MSEKVTRINEGTQLPLSVVGVLIIVTFSVGITYATIMQVKEDVADLKQISSKLTEIVIELKAVAK